MSPKSIYIHIPFCTKKCYYCDFTTFEGSHNQKEYLDYLKKEITLYPSTKSVDTIYFGGGTPSLLNPEDINDLLFQFNLSEGYEATLELNPELSSLDKLDKYEGITRLSIGCQTFNDDMLKKIGRIHSHKDSILVYEKAREHFDNISLDLMFGLPGQTLDMLKKDLNIIKELDPEHISIYSLIWKENTPFDLMKKRGTLKEVGQELEADMYEYIIEFLENLGYSHYEISSFGKNVSRHNLTYWRNQPYFGFGLGASSYYLNDRYSNLKSFSKYYESIDRGIRPKKDIEVVNKKIELEYEIILRLRLLKEGLSLKSLEKYKEEEFFSIYLKKIEKFIEKGLIEKKRERYTLTKKGLFLSNEVFAEIFS